MEDVANTPLGRKIAASAPRSDPLVVTPERALGTALARVAEKAMALPLRALNHSLITQTGAEVVETLPDHALLAMIEGPKESLGLAVLDPGAMSVLIEMMTLGRLGPRPPAQPRRPTRTDAAMIAGFLDATLAELETLLMHEDAVTWAGGFRYASHMADPRPLSLILDEPSYQVLRLTLGFGAGSDADDNERQGDVILILPARGRGTGPQPRAVADGAKHSANNQRADQGAKDWERSLEKAVMESQTEIEVVLARLILPLSDVLNLTIGTYLPMPMAVLKLVQVEGATGTTLCLGSLGQGNSHRAVRVYSIEGEQALPAGLRPIASELVSPQDQPLTRAPKPPPMNTEQAKTPEKTGAPEPALVIEATDTTDPKAGPDPAGGLQESQGGSSSTALVG